MSSRRGGVILKDLCFLSGRGKRHNWGLEDLHHAYLVLSCRYAVCYTLCYIRHLSCFLDRWFVLSYLVRVLVLELCYSFICHFSAL
jgi:hypothetical protein